MSTNTAIDRLEAAIRALGEVDLADWSDSALHTRLDELSAALCQVDAHLARLADAVRARGYRVAEPVGTVAEPVGTVAEPISTVAEPISTVAERVGTGGEGITVADPVGTLAEPVGT
jgi:hypothetical protein